MPLPTTLPARLAHLADYLDTAARRMASAPRDPDALLPLLAAATHSQVTAIRAAYADLLGSLQMDVAATTPPPPFRPPQFAHYQPPENPLFAPGSKLSGLDEAAAELTRGADLAQAAATTAAQDRIVHAVAAELAERTRTLHALAAVAHFVALTAEANAAQAEAHPSTDSYREWLPHLRELLAGPLTQDRALFPAISPSILEMAATADAAVECVADPECMRYPRTHTPVPTLAAMHGVFGDPALLGNLSGLPWELRITANAISLRRAAQRERLAARDWSFRMDRLNAMDRLRPDPVTGRSARRSFLAFDPAGAGRMIELVGDPAIAEGLALYVPGTGTNLDMSHVNTEVAENLVRIGGGRIACLVFVGGSFPQNMWVESGDPVFAFAMAPHLVRCGWDVQAHLRQLSRDGESGPRLPVTVIGHSFGGAVVGTAETLGLWADRVVYCAAASAGPGVRSASQWRNSAPQVHRYSMTAPGDPIELTQIWAGLRYPDAGHFDIMDGVTRLDTGFFDSGQVVFGTRGHGGILDVSADALWQVAKVVLGQAVVPYVPRSVSALGTTSWARHDGRLGPTAIAQIRAQLSRPRRGAARDQPIVVEGPGPLVRREL